MAVALGFAWFFCAGFIYSRLTNTSLIYLSISIVLIFLLGLLELRTYKNGRKELEIRILIGAGPMDLFKNLLTESIILSLFGAMIFIVASDYLLDFLHPDRFGEPYLFLSDQYSLWLLMILIPLIGIVTSLIRFISLINKLHASNLNK